jgi:hypothetical protein
MINTGEIGNGTALHRAKETLLPVSVAAPVPVAISVSPLGEPAMRGATYPVKVKVERRDDFKGAVEVSLLYGPTGISTVGPVKVPEDVSEVVVPLSVAPVAALGKTILCMQANLDPGAGRVWVGSNLYELEVVEAPLAGTFLRSSISQGGSGVMKLKLTPKTEFEGKLKVELLGLPTGVTAEPREVDAQTTEIEFPLTATQEAAVGLQKQVIAQFTVARGGVELVATCATGGIIRVDRGAAAKTSGNGTAPISVAKNETSKPAAAPTGSEKPATPEGASTAKPQTITK